MTPEQFISNVAGADYEQSLEKIKAEAMALKPEEKRTINVEIPAAVLTSIGALPKLVPFVAQISSLPSYDVKLFENFRDYTLALHLVQARYTHARAPKEQLPAMLVDATRRRDILLGDCGALIARGLLSKSCVSEYKGMSGYKNVAFDLTGLVELMTETWPQIVGKTMLTKEELDAHRAFALEFVQATAYRDMPPDAAASLGDMRQRVYTLFFRAYDQVRRAIIFLRWDEDDADTIIPSLFAGRGGNAKKTDATLGDAEQPPAATPEAASPAAEAPVPVVAASAKLPVGHPAASSFTQA